MRPKPDYPYVWIWPYRPADRKGQRCRIVAEKASGSVMIEFEDGYRVVSDRRGLRKPAEAD